MAKDDLFDFDDIKDEPLIPDVKKSAPKKKPTPSRKKIDIKSGIEEFYTSIGLGVAILNQKDGEILVSNAERAGTVWEHAAQNNPRIQAALEKFLTASTLAEVMAFHIGILTKIAANHNLIPSKVMDAVETQNGHPFGVDPSTIDPEMLREVFPQLNND